MNRSDGDMTSNNAAKERVASAVLTSRAARAAALKTVRRMAARMHSPTCHDTPSKQHQDVNIMRVEARAGMCKRPRPRARDPLAVL